MTHEPQSLPLTCQPEAVLYQETAPVTDPLSSDIQNLITDMFLTMRTEHGVGLAATQVGKSLRLAVIEADDKKFVLINPEIITKSSERIVFTEGCLSIPGEEFPIVRHEKITVRYTDATGKQCKIKLKGFLAIVFQHEIDHLDGILIATRYDKQSVLRAENPDLF